MTVLQNCKRYIERNYFWLLFPLLFIVVSLTLVLLNGSWLFQYDFISKIGDQRLYYRLAYGLVQGEFPKSLYTIGYPLFYAPFIVITGVSASWQSIMSYVIPVQSLLLMPATVYLIVKDKTKRNALVTLGIMLVYLAYLALFSSDRLIVYNFFGLIPLSEPLAIFCLIASYYVYLKLVKQKQSYKGLALLAMLFAFALMTRNTIVILFLPLLADMALDKAYKRLVMFGLMSSVFYFPQLLYNHASSNDWFFSGYMWWAAQNKAKDMANIEQLYGITSDAMFSLEYLRVNVVRLAASYLPVAIIGAAIRWCQKDRFSLLVLLCSLVNVLFFLSYWWSAAGGLLDRFLLPNFFLLMFIIGNRLLKQKGIHEDKRRHQTL